MSVYLHDWAEGGKEQMLSDFGIGEKALDGANVLVASYTYKNYSGAAYVLFERSGGLYEVHGSHCSCYGLRDYPTQWQPERTTAEAVLHWINHGRVKDVRVADAVRKALLDRKETSHD